MLENFKITHWFGDKVYVISDQEQKERIVTGIKLRPNGGVIYLVSLEANEDGFYDLELTTNKDVLKCVK